MAIRGSIKSKLILIFLLIALIPSIALGALSYFMSKDALVKQLSGNFDAIAGGKEEAVDQYLLGAQRALWVYSHSVTLVNNLKKINAKSADALIAADEIQKYIDERLKINPAILEFIVLDKHGKVVACTEPKEIGQSKAEDPYFTGAQQHEFFIKDVYLSQTTGKVGYVASIVLKDIESDEFVGVFAERMELSALNEIMKTHMGLGQTGETYLVRKDGMMITNSRFENDHILKTRIDTPVFRRFLENGKDGAGVYRDYGGNMTLGVVSGEELKRTFDYLGWAVIAEINEEEAFAPVRQLGIAMLALLLLVIVGVVVTALIVATSIAKPIKGLADVAGEVANGDLTGAVPPGGTDEIGILSKSFADMMGNLRLILVKIQEATGQITSAGNEILAATQQQASAAREQSSAVAETTSAAKELSTTSEQVGESIKKVAQVAAHAMAGMSKIKESISKTNDMLTSLGEKSQKIGKITELIDDVADQTNLLAVNASIEAARAGEQGRGFTVVADEIRKLADSTAKSTKDITALIELIQHEMSNAIVSMEQSVNSVDEEAKLAQQTTEKAKEIAMSTHQQVSGSKQIADAMMNIDEAMKQIATGAQQSQVSVQQLTALAQELKQMATKFKL